MGAIGNIENKFIPALWSAKILEALDKQLVYGELFNRDYEGDISAAGDTVHIGQVGDVTIKDYVAADDIADPDDVNVTDQTLKIDQGDYFNIAVSDVAAVQSKLSLLDEATARAGYGFGDKTDQYLAKLLHTGAGITDGLGTKQNPIVITSDNAYETLVHMKTALDKANVPKVGRKVVVPPEFEGFMLLDPRFVQVAVEDSQARLTEGTIYRGAGFDIRVSNNVPNEKGGSNSDKDVYSVIGTTPMQGTFADQILKTEAYRPEKRFGDAVKGLHVYGAKILRPKTVAKAVVAFK